MIEKLLHSISLDFDSTSILTHISCAVKVAHHLSFHPNEAFSSVALCHSAADERFKFNKFSFHNRFSADVIIKRNIKSNKKNATAKKKENINFSMTKHKKSEPSLDIINFPFKVLKVFPALERKHFHKSLLRRNNCAKLNELFRAALFTHIMIDESRKSINSSFAIICLSFPC